MRKPLISSVSDPCSTQYTLSLFSPPLGRRPAACYTRGKTEHVRNLEPKTPQRTPLGSYRPPPPPFKKTANRILSFYRFFFFFLTSNVILCILAFLTCTFWYNFFFFFFCFWFKLKINLFFSMDFKFQRQKENWTKIK